ncbi:hypothetical protein Taro_008892 [Colocasia esculenta]|uniref:Pirin C-terminal domain-containing protein n=1 Tax=Colocasia esculenta TaxID=4460 RepID=A0A843TUZ0_COLES|nr:hypothetical protein [Colocasia esculenta]
MPQSEKTGMVHVVDNISDGHDDVSREGTESVQSYLDGFKAAGSRTLAEVIREEDTRARSSAIASPRTDIAGLEIPVDDPESEYAMEGIISRPGHYPTIMLRFRLCMPEFKNLDPFLMLDEFSGTPPPIRHQSIANSVLNPMFPLFALSLISAPAGFPDHPHRGGFHPSRHCRAQGDDRARRSRVDDHRPRDHPFRNAGRGRRQHGPAALDQPLLQRKCTTPNPIFLELQSKDVSRVEKDGIDIRIIASEAFGVKSLVYTCTPTMYLGFFLEPSAQVHQRVPKGWNAFIYVLEGEGVFGGAESSPMATHHTLVLGIRDGLST